MQKLNVFLLLLSEQGEMPAKYLCHPLTGNWFGYWEAHLEPDWLVIYKIQHDVLFLARTGSHADLFK